MERTRNADKDTRARLVAYKAHKLGRDSIARGTGPKDERTILLCIEALERQDETNETVLIRLFYFLVLAEIHRASDAAPDRSKAQALGQALQDIGLTDPFPLYMKIIRQTTNAVTAGNYGDMKTRGVKKIEDSTTYIYQFGEEVAVDLAKEAVGLSGRELYAYDAFLGESLEELTRRHLSDT